MLKRAIRDVMELYPRIYFACHTRHVRDDRAPRTLSARQASILDHLDVVEPTAVVELAGHLGVTPGTMSLAVERLVRQGYVKRSRDARDGRRRLIRLTADGLRLREAKSVLDPERVRDLLARLSPAERASGLAGLALLARAAQAAMHDRAARPARRKRRES
jgi:DNA-binding MarR family transcriptional regulator